MIVEFELNLLVVLKYCNWVFFLRKRYDYNLLIINYKNNALV